MILTYRGLNVEVPYDGLEVQNIEIIEEINDHSKLKLRILVKEEKLSEYTNKDISEEKVTITNVSKENGSENKLFVGKINNVKIYFERGLYVMELQCISYTKDFDIKKNSKTFCNLDMTYVEVINKILEKYDRKSFIDNLTQEKAIEEFILQYEETEWEFLKRIASRFNGVLVPECTEDYGRFHFGIPEINNNKELKIDEYEVVKDIHNYNKHEVMNLQENFLQEYTNWEIISNIEMSLGEKIVFNNVKCVISKIKIETYKDDIRRIYRLSLKRGLRSLEKLNHKIFGMSLPATVKDVKGNTMCVHFEIDKQYETYTNQKYFTYAIESSSWYCMPEKESKVHIYFPTNDEKDSIAIHAVRANSGYAKYSSKTQNPDIKSFSHTGGSEMQLTPSDISFAADEGRGVVLTLSQGGDVSINGQDITFNASEDFQLGIRNGDGENPPFRPEAVEISAKNQISLSKGAIGIQMAEQIFVNASVIKYDGSIKDAVALPDEIANVGSKDDDMIKEINNQAKSEMENKLQEAKSKTGFGLVAAAIGAVAVCVGVAVFAAATVATGGLTLAIAGVAVASGVAATAVGVSEVGEGLSDYSKVQSGDYSQSYNFMRDTICKGNEALYKAIKYGSVLIAGAATAVLTGGATTEALVSTFKKMGVDAAMDASFNLLADYADDGKINNGAESYIKSLVTSNTLSNMNIAGMNKLKSLEKAKNLSCNALKVIRISSDIGLDVLGQIGTSGDANITTAVLKKYVGNKLCFSDPVDGATGSLYIPATDIVLPDIHEEFKIERKYESLNHRCGLLGIGWTVNFETLLNEVGEKVNILCSDGHIETFYKINNEYINDKGGARLYSLNQYEDYWEFKSYPEKKTYIYDNEGKLINIADKNNNKLYVTYVEKNIKSITTFSNYKLFFTYKDNKIIEIRDELGRSVQYKYEGDYLTHVVHVDQGITKYSYNENGLIDSITDQNGQTYTKNFFDKKGRVIRQDFPNNDNCVITYDDINKEVSFYYEQSKRTEKTRFNKDGLITHLFYEDGTTEEFTYDEYENKNYIKDRNGFETFKVFNEYGSLLKETLSNGLVKEYVYDEEQNLLKERDNLGKEILFTYDNKGNLLEKKTKISVGEYKTESYTYDSYGRITAKVDGNGNISNYEYDSGSFIEGKKGKDPVRVITNSGYDYEYEYDEVGRNTSISTDYGTIEFGYNNLDYVSKIKDGNGNVTLKYYDKMGNLISIYTPNACLNNKQNGQGYYYKYDHMDRLISIKNPLGIIDKSIRDSEGNIIKEINPNYYDDKTDNGLGIEHVYDKDNRKIKTIYPDGGIERFYYDANGNVIRHISPEYYNKETDNGTGFSYTYNSLNKLTSIYNEEIGITEKTFEYDLHGNIIKEIDNDKNATLFKYDLANNLIEKKVPVEIVSSDSNESLESKNKYQVTSYCYDKNRNKILEKHEIDAIFEDEICNNYNEIYFTYDKENRLIEVKDKCGAKARYKYDCLNNKIYESFKINDTTNKIIHYVYDKVGNLIEKKEEIDGKFISSKNKGKNIWSITKYEYDKNGNLTKIITPKGYEIVKVYDEIDRIIEEHEKDETNNIFRSRVYAYDKANNIISINEYSGEEAKLINSKYSSEFNYDLDILKRYENKKENEKLLKELDFKIDKRKKNYTYDSQNRLTHFTNVSGNTARLFYDKNDRIIKQVLPKQYDETKDNGVGTTYKYNIKGQVVEVKNALGETVTKNTYDPKGNLKTSVDGENNKVEYTYTLLGQIKDVVTPNSKKEERLAQSYKYDARGNITGITDGNGNETSYLLDDWGRIIQITTPEGGIEKYTYDYAGNITSTTDANGGIIEYFYNSLGQVCEIKDQEGNSEYFYYDEEGNLIKHIDRNENIVNRKYNIDRNIVSVEAYKLDNKAIENEKILLKNSETLSLEQGKPKRSRDFRKRVLENLERKEKGLENSYPYKTENNINNNSNDEVNEYEKYKLNVINQRFKYNPDGTLNNAYTGNMMYNYTYNDEKLLESKSASGRTLISYTYDKNNNIKSIKDITGKSSIYSYDNANRVKTIVDDNQNTLASYDYYQNDNIKTVTLGNGIKSDYTYDGDGNVESLVTITSTGEVLVDYKYAYDLNGSRLQKVSSKHKNFYSYDSMNRLVGSSYDDRCESFTYDKVGNRLSKTTNDITEKYVYNVKNQLKELHNKNGVNYFTYDKQGNTIKEETKDGNNIFEYNTLNQQVKAITKEGNTLANRYDTEGLRCEIEENEKLSKFIFNKNGDILVETDTDDNVISRFTRGYEIVAADIADKASSSINYSLSRYYYSVDEKGSTNFITDDSGNIKNEYWYDAFGNVLASKEDVHNRITYTGQQFDGITQQYYLRARFYNPVVGRFTQEDVYRGDGLNLYAYCGNNPVIYYDPSGYAKKSKKAISDMSYDEIVSELNQYYKEHVEKKRKKYPPEKNSNKLLDKELTYGPHGKHIQKTDDNLTGHHMPSQQFMGDKCKVEFDDAYSLNLEQIFPGIGGRHRRTFTYGVKGTSRKYQLYSKLTPRDAIAFDMYDARRILKEDGLYNKETRKILKDYINDYKNSSNSKGVFNKDNKLNRESSRVKQCKKK
ncbi:RHS repeat-associated core domain-containing protein [Clostridium botulinum]|uniref:RHS repeat-associated core domain-containing protein n=1 Tax=Clostridium botulinum TaxID=1491 RepID=UPI0009B3A942|nr:RHS repeat-associated core domain-containing protein [Clostridium botulinum]NFL87633.1 RHS repeat-associated core domain-containing protein [Clostridium botulinum]NFO20303.1 RHS repeat-associated core domain-containing protein [Clostridium botulinum]